MNYETGLRKLEQKRKRLFKLKTSNKIRKAINKINHEINYYQLNFTQPITTFKSKLGVNHAKIYIRQLGKVGFLKLKGFKNTDRDFKKISGGN